MKGRPLRGGDATQGVNLPAGGHASMKGRPLKGGDSRPEPDGRRPVLHASMKGRPLKGGDVTVPSGGNTAWPPR